MRTNIRNDRLLVISDLHIGNLLHSPRRPFKTFLEFALENRYSVCLNGDGLDITQLSMSRLNADLVPTLPLLMRFQSNGLAFYYTVGNHDIALEHFLSDMGGMKVVPFLNLKSGDKRIRLEHGHMYDDMFLRYPWLYFRFMMIGRLAISLGPKFYDALHHLNMAVVRSAEFLAAGFKTPWKKEPVEGEEGLEAERECFRAGAENVGMRGFDAVVFGHTHSPGHRILDGGTPYYNTGDWFSRPFCVAIDHGRIWFGSLADLSSVGDPFPLEDAASSRLAEAS